VGWIALLDACVLFSSGTRDLLLRAAERDLYQVRWSQEIIEEVRRNVVRDQRCSAGQADSLIQDMYKAFPMPRS
jgi:hypothetical protein